VKASIDLGEKGSLSEDLVASSQIFRAVLVQRNTWKAVNFVRLLQREINWGVQKIGREERKETAFLLASIPSQAQNHVKKNCCSIIIDNPSRKQKE